MMKKIAAAFLALSMIGASCMANALAVDDNQNETPFTDVAQADFCYDAVLWALRNGVTAGTSETTFSPDATCTRGQVVSFLWRAAGCPEPTMQRNPFQDVREEDYYYKPVLWAVTNQITHGTSETTFSPDALCTNAHVVTFLWNANGQPESVGSSMLAAAYPARYYTKAVAWADTNGLLSGSERAFVPEEDSPRANIVTYLYRNAQGEAGQVQQGSLQTGTIHTSQVQDFSYLLYTPAAAHADMPLIVHCMAAAERAAIYRF